MKEPSTTAIRLAIVSRWASWLTLLCIGSAPILFFAGLFWGLGGGVGSGPDALLFSGLGAFFVAIGSYLLFLTTGFTAMFLGAQVGKVRLVVSTLILPLALVAIYVAFKR